MGPYEEALGKLAKEAAGEKAGQQIGQVAEITRRLIARNPAQAEKLLDSGKSCAKAFEAMKAAAKKKAVGGCYCMTDDEAEALIAEYWGIDAAPAAEPQPPQAPAPAGDLLDDLLGGL